MFIDYVPLMLINVAAGLFMLAFYVYSGIDDIDQKGWVSGFLIVGLVAFINGIHMTWTWPLPGSYNVVFGQMSVLLGALFLGAGLSLAKGWDLFSLFIYAFFAGLTAIVIGIRIINLGLTKEPLLSGIGFILTGLAGLLIGIVFRMRENRMLRLFLDIILIVAAFIWIRAAYFAYWQHLESLSEWVPTIIH